MNRHLLLSQAFRRAGLLLLGLGIVAIAMFFLSAPVARADLPPRPATTTPEAPVVGPAVGGWIQVRVTNARAAQWVIVQWQDELGAWHNVESWRGEFDTYENGVGTKTWWVDNAQFGAPNFRWAVYEASRTASVAQSEVFALPIETKQTVTVQVSLTP